MAVHAQGPESCTQTRIRKASIVAKACNPSRQRQENSWGLMAKASQACQVGPKLVRDPVSKRKVDGT